jgi:hypothetical protein
MIARANRERGPDLGSERTPHHQQEVGMTRTDVVASVRPQAHEATSIRRRSPRASRRLLGPPGCAAADRRACGADHSLRRGSHDNHRLQPDPAGTGQRDVAVQRKKHAEKRNCSGESYEHSDHDDDGEIKHPAVHRVRPSLDGWHRAAPDGCGLLDRDSAASPAPQRRQLTAGIQVAPARAPSGRTASSRRPLSAAQRAAGHSALWARLPTHRYPLTPFEPIPIAI